MPKIWERVPGGDGKMSINQPRIGCIDDAQMIGFFEVIICVIWQYMNDKKKTIQIGILDIKIPLTSYVGLIEGSIAVAMASWSNCKGTLRVICSK